MKPCIDEAGYEVVATLDRFGDAIETLDREQVDLILSDVRLTGERTGIDLAQESRRRSIPVLFVTGNAPDEFQRAGRRLPDEALQRANIESRAERGRPASWPARRRGRPRALRSFPKAEV